MNQITEFRGIKLWKSFVISFITGGFVGITLSDFMFNSTVWNAVKFLIANIACLIMATDFHYFSVKIKRKEM